MCEFVETVTIKLEDYEYMKEKINHLQKLRDAFIYKDVNNYECVELHLSEKKLYKYFQRKDIATFKIVE
jgi:hypothetical protein